MPKHQVITSPNGDEMVIVPKAEYDRLVRRPMTEAEEDEADARMGAAILERIKRGEEETFPFALIQRISAGDSRIKVYREHRGLTQKELAAKVGINPVYLSQIETGVKTGSVDTLSKIAQALKVNIDMVAPEDSLLVAAFRDVMRILSDNHERKLPRAKERIRKYVADARESQGREAPDARSDLLQRFQLDLMSRLNNEPPSSVTALLDKLVTDKTIWS